ncbi:MAG: hypothetical protein EA425_17490 [Puniceicoccaceae bacterium]|nr:MAG: hypothetical protein EA425_17490 [Puniceicoccaceae bacterium]
MMVAMELWRLSGRSEYLEQAQLAWFNALGHGQRANGGFGCDNCPGADGEDDLFFKTEESHWCCSMRGAEGLARMTQFCAVRSGDTLCLPFGLPGSYASGPHRFEIESGYPRVARWTFLNRGPDRLRISLYLPSWVDDIPGRDSNGWLAIDLAPGSTHLVEGSLSKRSRPVLPSSLRLRPEAEGRHVHMEGPLILGQSGERWEPIAFDYQRGDLNKANSGKRILHTT